MKLKKCPSCDKYTLKENCPRCKNEAKEVNHKTTKLRNAPKRFIRQK